MMLRQGRVFPGKKTWGATHRHWLEKQRFEHPAHRLVLQEMLLAVRHAEERLERIEAAIAEFLPTWSLAPVVEALQALRGIGLVGAVTIMAEIGDLRRFDSPRQLMGYLGLVPGERSTGESVHRLGITKAGNGRVRRALVESAWSYRHLPRTGPAKRLRPRARAARRTRHRGQGAGAALRPLPGALGQGQEADRDGDGSRPRAGGLRMGDREGGADGSGYLNRAPSTPPACKGGGGATAEELPLYAMWPALLPTPALRPGTPRTHNRNCGSQPAYQSLITDVYRPCLLPCALIHTGHR